MDRKQICALLPSGKYFDRLLAEVLAPWAEARGAGLQRLDPSAASLASACRLLEPASLVIADLSGRNPGVMFLAGCAQGIGKRVIFAAQFQDDFPFDAPPDSFIIYSGHFPTLREALDSIDGRQSEGSQPARNARELFLEKFGEIMRKHGQEHRGGYEMEGASTFVLRDQDLDLPLVQELSRRARELGLRIKLM